MKVLAKTAAVLASISVLATTMVPVLADSATNDTTGAKSLNNTSVTNTNNVKVTNVSDAYIKNEVQSYSNTGNNSASKNTMGGMVMTGDAGTEVSIMNTANVNTTMVDLGGSSAGGNAAGNSITGAESINIAAINNTNNVAVRNDNTAVLMNMVKAKSNTGGNWADMNTDGTGGSVLTGDANTVVSLSNKANDSLTTIEGLRNSGTNLVGNSITGYHSLNNAAVANLNNVAVTNVSDAAVFNMVRADANSGRNTASMNTMGGAVLSGDAGVGIQMLTDANINTTAIDVAMGGFSETSGNSITGAESTNNTALTNANNVSVLNRNNKGSSEDAKDYVCGKGTNDPFCVRHWGVVNIDNDYSNTGGNWADMNTYPGSIASGIAAVGKYIRVCLNDTMTLIGVSLPQD
jgi:hypothetical protein